MTDYSDPAPEQPVVEKINGGRLHRDERHRCPAPGLWKRIWCGVHEDDVWECSCGVKWKWSGISWHSGDGRSI